eukprot:TRINITY_DN441_c0_g3_i5.p1 TRINITY_DN441_c0_g3~~TRINITY_DN441_c0_g3_i5.p1  ORF type:complete len:141 (-),score=38.88 TRINITY_DN441_c0_g3_i5:61-483(-)
MMEAKAAVENGGGVSSQDSEIDNEGPVDIDAHEAADVAVVNTDVKTFESKTPPKYHEWVDFNEIVSTAAKDMEPGQMMQVNGFGLYEAMSAMEIMDPKMDSGMNAEGVYNLDEARKLGLFSESDLTIPQIIATRSGHSKD